MEVVPDHDSQRRQPAMTQKSAKRKTSKGFTDEEKSAMRERAREVKAGTVDGESEVLAKIAEMQESDRAMAERVRPDEVDRRQ
jgi:hypothetical protein